MSRVEVIISEELIGSGGLGVRLSREMIARLNKGRLPLREAGWLGCRSVKDWVTWYGIGCSPVSRGGIGLGIAGPWPVIEVSQ
jgi:hypothetical protein